MTNAQFIHYVVCEFCRRQHRLSMPGVAVMCCRFVWFFDGPRVVRYKTRYHFRKDGA